MKIICLLFIFLCSVAQCQETSLVGKLLEFDGNKLTTHRTAERGWFLSYEGMPLYVKESLKTDPETTGFALFKGGGFVMGPGTSVKFLTSKSLEVKEGCVWVRQRIPEQTKDSQLFTVRESSRSITLIGSEVIIKSGQLSHLIVIQGEASLNGLKIKEGQHLQFNQDSEQLLDSKVFSQSTKVEQRRRLALSRLNTPEELALLSSIKRAFWFAESPGRWGRYFYGPAFWTAREAVELRKETSITVELDEKTARFTWDEIEDSHHYRVVLTEDPEFNEIIWYGRTSNAEPNLAYPDHAPQLKKGEKYYGLISSYDKQDKIQSSGGNGPFVFQFEGTDHQPKLSGTVNAKDPNDNWSVWADWNYFCTPVLDWSDRNIPEISWKKVKMAAHYRILFRDVLDQVVWRGETDRGTSHYRYPINARSLEPGVYGVEVHAYDSSGHLLGCSRRVSIMTTGWESEGFIEPKP